MSESWEIGWMACALDSEGNLCVSRDNVRKGRATSYCPVISIYNSDEEYIKRCVRILESWGVHSRVQPIRKLLPKHKQTYGVHIGRLEDIITVLGTLLPYLTAKRAFAIDMLAFAIKRLAVTKVTLHNSTRWPEQHLQMAQEIRRKHMPRSKLAYGEIQSSVGAERTIPSEASGSAIGTEEPLERRTTSSTCSNSSHECPASLVDDDVRRYSEESERGDNKLRKDIATN